MWLKSSIRDDAVNTGGGVGWGVVHHIACQTSTLTVNHFTVPAQFTLVSITAKGLGVFSTRTFSLLLEIFTSQM